jgi:hypothetical protein
MLDDSSHVGGAPAVQYTCLLSFAALLNHSYLFTTLQSVFELLHAKQPEPPAYLASLLMVWKVGFDSL